MSDPKVWRGSWVWFQLRGRWLDRQPRHTGKQIRRGVR